MISHLIGQAGIGPGYLLLLQVTSPLRTLADLDRLKAEFEAETEAGAAVSLCRYEGSHPAKMLRIEDDKVAPFLDQAYTGPRQALADVFVLNGAFYLIDRTFSLQQGTFLPEPTMPFVMEASHSANLDTLEDWQVLQAMLAQGFWTAERYD